MAITGTDMSPADFGAIIGNNENSCFGGGGGAYWLIILFLFIFAGGWGGRSGVGGGSTAGAADNYVLTSDFAQIERKLDSITNGLCDGFYTQAQLVNGVQQSMATQGYETRNAITQAQIGQMQSANALQAQLAQCCCDNRAAIADVNYNIASQANGLTRSIDGIGYAMAAQNNQTLQAIDKVGDRVIDYLSNQENQRLRDEIAMYRDKANSQYVINEINKCPIPAYLTCNPNAPLNYNISYGNGCGCA